VKTGYDAAVSASKRLDDEDGTVWTLAEMMLYAKDGYAELCRRSKCLFDMHVIPNAPQVGNWSSDLEWYLASKTPGMALTDEKMHFTAGHEKGLIPGGHVVGPLEGPTPGTSQGDAALFDTYSLPKIVAQGRLPEETVDVVRVTWDEHELPPEDSAWMRRLDPQYERREGGDPRHFVMDKDGMLNVRLVPPARGDAVYPTVVGSWGGLSQTDEDVTVVMGQPQYDSLGNPEVWGALTEVEGAFPAGGPWGSPTQMHPAEKNTVVEILRIGRSLDTYSFEIPSSFIKYVVFWIMHRALRRNGPGQDLKLSQHYKDRFNMGVGRMKLRLREIHKDSTIKIGSGGADADAFGMGDPRLPYPYGPSTGRR